MSMIINLSTTHVSCKSVKKFLFRATLNYHFFFYFFLCFLSLSCLFWFIWFGLVWFASRLDIGSSFTFFHPSICLCMRVFHVSVSLCVRYFFLFFSLNGSRLQ